MNTGGSRDCNTGTPGVTVNSVTTSKSKVTGEKRKRYSFSVVQTSSLEVEFGKGNLKSKEGRQKVGDDFIKGD